MAVRLSNEQTRHLIELYHGHDVLWNTESQAYKNQLLRDRALISIPMFCVLLRALQYNNSSCSKTQNIGFFVDVGHFSEKKAM